MRHLLRTAIVCVATICLAQKAYPAEKIPIPHGDRAWAAKIRNAADGSGASSSFNGKDIGLTPDHTFQALREHTDKKHQKHVRYKQRFKGIPVLGKELIVHQDRAGNVLSVNGDIVKDIEKDLDEKQLVPKISSATALERAKKVHKESAALSSSGAAKDADKAPTPVPTRSDEFVYRNEHSDLVIFVDDNNKSRLAYYVNFFTEKAGKGSPSRPHFIIDASTGEILKRWDGLAKAGIGTGPGGNLKTGLYQYGTNYGFLDVLQNGATCTLQTPQIVTTDAKNGVNTNAPTPFAYTCPENTYKLTNGAYSPLNDAHFFGQAVFNMYQEWYGAASPLLSPMEIYVHYDVDYSEAYWDGFTLNFGDGDQDHYPYTVLDLTAHEISHAFTDQFSDLSYREQSGGVNEAFSDMAGKAAELYVRGSHDWRVGADVVKDPNGSLRYMDNPPADGASIDHASKFVTGMEVHNSSGVFNKAFYLLATKPGWGTRKAFDVMVKANQDYWVTDSTFNAAACGVISAAGDLGYNSTDVDAAFNQVGVYCGGPEVGEPIATAPTLMLAGRVVTVNVNTPIMESFSASGGAAPYSWSIGYGSLPPGVQIDGATGVVSGTPTAAGVYKIAVAATDSAGKQGYLDSTILVTDGVRNNWPQPMLTRQAGPMSSYIYAPIFADLDGDGRQELIVADNNSSLGTYRLSVFYADGSSRIKTDVAFTSSPAVADLFGDGRKEIILNTSDGTVHALYPDLTPVNGFPVRSYQQEHHIGSAVVADLNGDGKDEIIHLGSPYNSADPNYRRRVLSVWDGQGQPVLGWPRAFGVYQYIRDIDTTPAVGELYGDGKKQLVVATNDGYIRIFAGDGTMVKEWQYGQDVYKSFSPVLADMDGDGSPDIVIKYRDYATNSTYTKVFDRNGNLLPGWPATIPDYGWYGVTAADLDGDGSPEILTVGGEKLDALYVFRSDGTPQPGFPATIPVYEQAWSMTDGGIVVADLDGDGKQDILFTATRTVGYTPDHMMFGYDRTGAPLAGFPKHLTPNTFPSNVPAVGDFDGNGKKDIAAVSSEGYLWVWEMPQAGAGTIDQWPMARHDARHSSLWQSGQVSMTPASYDFSTAGGSTGPQSFSISNPWAESVTISSIAVTGSDAADFTVAYGTCGAPPVTVAPHQSCSVTVTFSPKSAGQKQGALTVTPASSGARPTKAILSGSVFSLVYTGTGDGQGTVSSSTGTSYSSSGSEPVAKGILVTLTPAPAEGSLFMGWEGACTGTGTCTVLMTQDRNVSAKFRYQGAKRRLTIETSGRGTVAYPGGSCPGECTSFYDDATVVTLTKTSFGADFAGWGGACTGTADCTITMNGDKQVSATFLAPVQPIAAGFNHSVAVVGGVVSAWGANSNGQIGDGTTILRLTPTTISTSGVSSVSAGIKASHTVATKSNGTVLTWGKNDYGQLGDNTSTQRTAPFQIPGMDHVAAVGSGMGRSFALKEDGAMWAWGENSSGSLGDGTTGLKRVPALTQLTNVSAVTSGEAHSAALKGDGTVWTFGANNYGQLGDGTLSTRYSPVQVAGLQGVTAVASGGYHTVALKADGTVWTWGHNGYGQLGDGTITNRSTPVQVPGLSGVVAIASGYYFNLALKGDGTVMAWGDNSYGQLGDGTTTQRRTPVAVPTLSGVVRIAAGTYHAVAAKSDGSIWSWGYNNSGQIGDGTMTNRSAPVRVQGVSLDMTAPTTTVSRPGGSFSAPITVTLSTNKTATIYYTLDGSYPSLASNVYTAPLTISGTTTLRYFARDLSGNSEALKTESYTYVEVPGMPASNFTSPQTAGNAPFVATFSDLSTGVPTSWQWSFGDGGSSTAKNPQHLYTIPGVYSVSLTTTNAFGSNTKTAENYVTVLSCPNQPVRLGGAGFADLMTALSQAADNDVISSQALSFTGDLLFSRNVKVTLKGGYDCGYGSNLAGTSLLGKIRILQGTVKPENLRLQ